MSVAYVATCPECGESVELPMTLIYHPDDKSFTFRLDGVEEFEKHALAAPEKHPNLVKETE